MKPRNEDHNSLTDARNARRVKRPTYRSLYFGVGVLLLFGATGISLNGCATAGSAPESSSEEASNPSVDPERLERELKDEVKVGRAIAAGVIASLGVDQSLPEGTRTYVTTLGQALAKEFGRPGVKHYFEILDTDEENAYATPGGYIFVTRGLLNRMSNEDELVSVLGHELAHVNERHVYQILQARKEPLSGIAIIARLLGGGSGDLGMALSKAVEQGLDLLLKEGLGPELEKAADEIGLGYTASLGYDPLKLGKLVLKLDGDALPSRTSEVGTKTDGQSHLTGRQRADWLADRVVALELDALSAAMRSSRSPESLRERGTRFRKSVTQPLKKAQKQKNEDRI